MLVFMSMHCSDSLYSYLPPPTSGKRRSRVNHALLLIIVWASCYDMQLTNKWKRVNNEEEVNRKPWKIIVLNHYGTFCPSHPLGKGSKTPGTETFRWGVPPPAPGASTDEIFPKS